LVAVFLKDSQTWTDFSEHLEVQATMCRELLNDFRVNELIREELQGDDPDSTNGINALSRKIDQFEKRCEKEIQLLERKTKEMIELVQFQFTEFCAR